MTGLIVKDFLVMRKSIKTYILFLLFYFVTVSYTHLDVYKRQEPSRGYGILAENMVKTAQSSAKAA